MRAYFYRVFIVLISTSSLYAGVAQANVSPNYYQATIPVKTQNLSERQSAAKLGLSQVLSRISGDQSLTVANVPLSNNKAWSYVQQFRYDALNDPSLRDDGYQRSLELSFDPSLVRNLLTQTGRGFWPTSRPKTLVWLVQDTSSGREFVNPDSTDNELLKTFTQAAMRRGLPLIFPVLDLEDQSNLSVNDVWSLNDELIRQASERYRPDVIFVGRFSLTSSGQMRATWQFVHAGQTQVYDSRSGSYSQVGFDALDPLAKFLASRYVIASGESFEGLAGVVLEVSNINSFGDYRSLLDYLESQPAFSELLVLRVSGDLLQLQVQSQVDLDRLGNTLALNSRLTPMQVDSMSQSFWQGSPEIQAEPSVLRYRWSN